MSKDSDFDYIRNYYGVPAKKGAFVSYKDKLGVVTGTTGLYVEVRLDGQKHALPYHPTDLNWQPSTQPTATASGLSTTTE